MKKIVLAVLVAAGVMTSCKKEAKEVVDGAKSAGTTVVDGAKAAGDAATKVVDGAKDAAADAGNAVADAASKAASALLGMDIPSFSVEGAKESLVAYAGYAKDYIAAGGDTAKITAMAGKGKELLGKVTEFAGKLSGEEAEKFGKIKNLIMSKMAPAK